MLPKNYEEVLKGLAKDIHQRNVDAGWWTDKDTGEDLLLTRNRPELMMLFVSEVSEADEGHQFNHKDDKLPHLDMYDVELADVAIRIFDTIGAENRRYGNEIEYDYINGIADAIERVEELSVDRRLLSIVNNISSGMEHLRKGRVECYRYELISTLNLVIAVAVVDNIDIFDVINQKLEFNKNRPDHKLENRKKEGGKAF